MTRSRLAVQAPYVISTSHEIIRHVTHELLHDLIFDAGLLNFVRLIPAESLVLADYQLARSPLIREAFCAEFCESPQKILGARDNPASPD